MVARSRVLRRIGSGVAFVLLMASGIGVLTWLRLWDATSRFPRSASLWMSFHVGAVHQSGPVMMPPVT